MLDLYLVIVPIFGVLTLLSLIALKLSIKDSVTLTKIRNQSQLQSQLNTENQEESPTKNVIKYMLFNFTPLEICTVRRAKYKLCLLLSISIIAIGTHFLPSPYYFVATGTIVYFTYFLVAMGMTFDSSSQNAQETVKKNRQKYMQVTVAIVSMALNFAMIGIIYKNYQNSVLTAFLANAGLNLVFDNFVVRPTISILVGIPLSFNTSFHQYVMECQKEVQLLELFQTVGLKQTLTKPSKMISPSKIAKNIPLQVQIEKPDSKTYLKRDDEDKHLEILKKIKRQKNLPPINIQHTIDPEFSINSLFNSSKKGDQSQISEKVVSDKMKRSGYQFQKSEREEEKISQQDPILPLKNKIVGPQDGKNKLGSQKLIMVNPSQQQHIENEEDIVTEHIASNKITQADEQNQEERKRGATYNVGQASNEPLRISINESQNPTSRQQPLRISIADNLNLDFQENRSDQEEDDPYKKRKELMTLDDVTNKNPNFGLLQIKEKHHQNQSQEIEEINLNSPERRRRQGLHVQYEVESKMEIVNKKKKKKLSHDNPRIVKFSTGEPYLEYLPNMLSKDAKTKKSQAISRKQIVMDSRIVSSVKRPPKKKVFGEHNQNIVPEFRIQEV